MGLSIPSRVCATYCQQVSGHKLWDLDCDIWSGLWPSVCCCRWAYAMHFLELSVSSLCLSCEVLAMLVVEIGDHFHSCQRFLPSFRHFHRAAEQSNFCPCLAKETHEFFNNRGRKNHDSHRRDRIWRDFLHWIFRYFLQILGGLSY